MGDFTGDGKLDLAVVPADSNTVSVFLGDGDGGFQSAANVGVTIPAVPLLANLSSLQAPDSIILAEDGTILYRQAIPNEPGTFAPPVPVNPAIAPARAIALVATSQGTLIAALDRAPDPITHLATISLYAYNSEHR